MADVCMWHVGDEVELPDYTITTSSSIIYPTDGADPYVQEAPIADPAPINYTPYHPFVLQDPEIVTLKNELAALRGENSRMRERLDKLTDELFELYRNRDKAHR